MLRYKTTLIVMASLMLSSVTCWSAEPTLARLGFWVPVERMTEFEAAYQKQIVPILKRHNLVASSERTRATVDSAFVRVFAFKTPAAFLDTRSTLLSDPAFQEVRRILGAAFGTSDSRGLIRLSFRIYRSPMGPGKRVVAGSGLGHWRTFDVPKGLAHNYVSSIFQDREGALWFGTARPGSGVSRYDGQTFTTFTTKDGLANNTVTSIIQDREGGLWFGTNGGVSRYDGQTFANLTTEDGLANNRVTSIAQDREGALWFGTGGGGVSRYDGQVFTTFTTKDGLADNMVTSILQDREGSLWFGTRGGGVSCYDGETWTTFTTQNGLAHNWVQSIIADREGNLWFGTRGGGVSRYDGQAFATFTTKDGLASNNIRSIFLDREGLLWFGTRGGTNRYDGQTFALDDELSDRSVISFLQDREGLLWFGTEASGVSRYDGQTFATFTTQNGLGHDVVVSIFQDREGMLWFGCYGSGVSRYDGQTFTTFTTQDGLVSNSVLPIVQDREGALWFGTRGGGVSCYDGQTLTSFTALDGLASNNLRSILLDREGVLWFCTSSGGVSRYDGEAFTTFNTQNGLVHNTVTKMLQDRDGLFWFCTDGGVSRYDGKTFTNFTTQDGLAHRIVQAIVQDREGVLWFGTGGGGVSRYDGETFTTVTAQDGLAHSTIYGMFMDREGAIWFGTYGGGVSRYDGQTWTTLTTQDGLAHNGVWGILQDREGAIWFGTMGGGVTRYRPPAPTPPPVFIDAVLADRRYENASDISIPSSVELAVFEFHGTSFKTRPEAMIYRYRLKGYEKDWRNTHEHRVEYQNLPRGTYTFEVQAVDRDLVYSDMPATVMLTVHLPYERIGWMSALGIAIVLIGWQGVRIVRRNRDLNLSNTALSDANKQLFQANQQIQVQTERKSAFLASMSHELRTPMNAIKGFTTLVIRRIGDTIPDRQRENLVKVTQASDHLLAMINDLLDLSKIEAGHMDVNPESFSVQALVASCCATVSPLVEEKPNVRLEYEVAEGMGEAHTDQGRLRQMLINLLSNAIKFTESGMVAVNAKQVDDRLVVSVSDTGKGIPEDEIDTIFDEYRQVKGSDREHRGTGLGLSITKKFAELLGGSIGVESEEGKGATFTVRVPLRYSGTM